MPAERSEEHTSELQSPCNLVCRLLLEKKKTKHFISSHGTTSTSLVHFRRHPKPRQPGRTVRSPGCCHHDDEIPRLVSFFFFLNDTAPTEISPLPLHAALPICRPRRSIAKRIRRTRRFSPWRFLPNRFPYRRLKISPTLASRKKSLNSPAWDWSASVAAKSRPCACE